MGHAYVELLGSDRDYLMLQHHSYAACDDEVIRDRVRALYARLVAHVERLSGAEAERIDEFFRYGMWLNVAAAMGVEDLSVGCEWVRAEGAERPGRASGRDRPPGSSGAGGTGLLVARKPVLRDRLPARGVGDELMPARSDPGIGVERAQPHPDVRSDLPDCG